MKKQLGAYKSIYIIKNKYFSRILFERILVGKKNLFLYLTNEFFINIISSHGKKNFFNFYIQEMCNIPIR